MISHLNRRASARAARQTALAYARNQPPYEPPGTAFFDNASKRQMRLVSDGHLKGWIVYRHPDGQWVSLRKATQEDIDGLAKAVAGVLHP